jgi:hypothetical protein
MADWISVEEAQQLSGYHPEHIRRLIREEKVHAEKKGGQWWVDRKSFIAYLDEAKSSEDQRRGPKAGM